jgi:hypothetical protein
MRVHECWLLCFEKRLLKLSASQPMREGMGVLEKIKAGRQRAY